MHDDGLHDDLEANDGIYGATIPSTETGTYIATAYVSGTHDDGTAFERTTQHLIPVVIDYFDFVGTATGEYVDKEHMKIAVSVVNQKQVAGQLFRAYAQVWGVDSNGNAAPACWIGGMTEVKQEGNGYVFEMELDLKWLSMAKVSPPLSLKEVAAQETDSYIPIDTADSMSVTLSTFMTNYITAKALKWNVPEITKEMRQGVRRTTPVQQAANTTAAGGKLVLLHGYCAGENPWSKYASDFTNAEFFLEANANMNNQQFATKVYNFVTSKGLSSFGIAGHSQGGTIGLHLLNYYETGLDYASGARLLQSLGTPYQGCSAAGSAANLGKLFGVGCGANTDLTTDGARLWLAGVTAEAMKEVNYYTTTYEQGKFFGDWCNLAMNAVLEWPNDGTCELDNAGLNYAKYMGNTEKQCHTTGMGYMAQYHDRTRNAVINANAAR